MPVAPAVSVLDRYDTVLLEVVDVPHVETAGRWGTRHRFTPRLVVLTYRRRDGVDEMSAVLYERTDRGGRRLELAEQEMWPIWLNRAVADPAVRDPVGRRGGVPRP